MGSKKVQMKKIKLTDALDKLRGSGREFVPVFENDFLTAELYSPHLEDKQGPHDREEFYLIISGNGKFWMDGAETDFRPGDFLYVPNGVPHRFSEFSEDFATWVFFI